MSGIRTGAVPDLARIKERLVASKPAALDPAALAADYAALVQALQDTYAMGSSNDQWYIVLNDTLAVCFLRMSQCVRAAQASFAVAEDHVAAVMDYVVRYSNHKSSPLINSLTALLTKAVAFYSLAAPRHLQDGLKHTVDLVVRRPLTKNLFNVLELVIRNLHDKQHLLQPKHREPGVARICLSATADDHTANSASKTFVTLFTGIYNAHDEPSHWYALWRDLVLEGLSSDTIRPNLVVYLLPNLVQTCPATLHLLIAEYSRLDTSTDPSTVDLLFNLYKIGQEKSIALELPANMSSFLTHYDPKIRLNALSVVLGGSAKNSKSLPIPDDTYQLIRDSRCIDTFLNDYEDIESRNKFVSLMTHFLGFRFKESMYALNKEFGKLVKKDMNPDRQLEIAQFLESGNLFIDWLIEHLTAYLNPASNYSQLVTSIQLLESISSKLDGMKNCSIYRDKLIHFLIQNLYNNYENIREMCLELLISCDPATIQNYFEVNQLQAQLVNQSYSILTSLTGRKSDGAAKFFEFLTMYHLKTNSFDKITRIIDSMIVRMSYGINLLKEGSNLERSEIYIHGYFKAMSLMFNRLRGSHLGYIKMISATIIDLIYDIWTLVEPLLSNSSFEDEEDVIDDDKILLNYSWKVIKDSNMLLSHILKMNVVDNGMFLRCSELIMSQLSSVKHRGAFSSIYPSFISTCGSCFASEELKEYPFKWLEENLKLIESKEQFISRRSGGIPYLISGILVAAQSHKSLQASKKEAIEKNTSSELPTTDRGFLLQHAFDFLLSVAQRPHLRDMKNDTPQVHAFNSIKQIFNETALATHSLDYVEASLELSLCYFDSPNWSIRNCAVMLFGVIQRRIFGSRNEARYPAKLFFERFPKMDFILHQELSLILEDNSVQKIFPVILVLSALDNSSEADNLILSKYKPLLLKLLSNRSWKIREISARCISTLFSGQELQKFSEEFLRSHDDDNDGMTLVQKIDDCKNLNEIQGCLRVISESFSRLDPKFSYEIAADLSEKHFDIPLKYPPFIVKVYVDIYSQIEKVVPDINSLWYESWSEFFDSSEAKLDGGRQLLFPTMISCMLQCHLNSNKMAGWTDESRLIEVIRLGLGFSDIYGVQISTIEFIKNNFQTLSSVIPKITEDVFSVISSDDFDYVRAKGLDLYSVILSIDNSFDNKNLELFLSLLDKNLPEDIQLNSLKCLASLAGHLDEKERTRLVEQCRELAQSSNSYKYRSTAIDALIQAHSRSETLKDINKFRMEALLVFVGLYDDDEGIRDRAAKYLSSYTQMSVSANASSLARSCLNPLAKKGGVLFRKALIEEFEKYTLNEVGTEKSNQSNVGETLFDVENNNLYINRVEVAVNFRYAFEEVGLIPHMELTDLRLKTTQDLRSVTEQVRRKGLDGILGWSRDPPIYVMVVGAVLNGETVTALGPFDEVSRALSDLRTSLDDAQIDLGVAQFLHELHR